MDDGQDVDRCSLQGHASTSGTSRRPASSERAGDVHPSCPLHLGCSGASLLFTTARCVSSSDRHDLLLSGQFVGRSTPRIIYLESFARTSSLSLTGKILVKLALAERVAVQWDGVKEGELVGVVV